MNFILLHCEKSLYIENEINVNGYSFSILCMMYCEVYFERKEFFQAFIWISLNLNFMNQRVLPDEICVSKFGFVIQRI
jgi:hypothetical protein